MPPVSASAFDRNVPTLAKALLAKMKPRSSLIENNLAAGAENVTGSTVEVAAMTPNSLEVLGSASAFSATVMLLVLCLFGCLRERYPAIYLKKVNEPGSHGEIPPDISSSFGWMGSLLEASYWWDCELFQFGSWNVGPVLRCSCDVLVVHRITCPSDSRVLFVPLWELEVLETWDCWAFPMWHNGSWITYVYPIFVWYTVVVTQAFIFRAQRAFVERRFQWLRTMTEPRANSVLLSNLPDNLLKESALRSFLEEQIFGSNKREVIQSLSFVKDTSQLSQLVAERARYNEDLQKIVQGEVNERRKAVARAEMNKGRGTSEQTTGHHWTERWLQPEHGVWWHFMIDMMQ